MYTKSPHHYNKSKTPTQELNPKNILVTQEFIQELLGTYGVDESIKDFTLYQAAFVHKTYVQIEGVRTPVTSGRPNAVVAFQDRSYERLEYIGDGILNAVIANYIYHRYPDQPEGFMTTLRTKLVRSNTLAKLTRNLGLGPYVLISKYIEEKCNGRKNSSILEDVFEALIGAIFLDFGGWEGKGGLMAQRFILSIFEKYIDITRMIRREDNYKKLLLEFYQKKYHTEPKYQIISIRGQNNNRLYTMGALSPTGEIVGTGISKRKIVAEQQASRNALIYYEEDVDSESSESE